MNRLLDTGYPGAPLDEVGLEQAAELPRRLAGEPIEVVMTSDITRARQTGEPLAKALGVPVITHPGVREIYAGDWEMSPDWRDYVRTIASWRTDLDAGTPNGENGHGFLARFDGAIAELQDYDCAAVVSHGGALRTWLTIRCGLDIGLGHEWDLNNLDTVIVEGTPSSWTVRSWAGRTLL